MSKYSKNTKTRTKLLLDTKRSSSIKHISSVMGKRKSLSRTPKRLVKSKTSKSRSKSASKTSKARYKVSASDAKLLKKEGVRTIFKLLQNRVEKYALKRYKDNQRLIMQYKEL